ncbi:MAG TPA: SpoIIE family protein phosphatase [Vicingus sp.]|nr:SpoIIE family protein phosphatase [Vicingus sp.]
MKKFLFIFSCIFLFTGFAQSQGIKSYNLHFGDTVNVTDNYGLKQGRWVYLGQDKVEQWFKEYKPDQVVEEGSYFNGKKTGTWRRYHINGKLQRELKYTNDTIDGLAKYYSKDGLLHVEGFQKGKDFVGDYFIYDSSGKRFKKEAAKKNNYALLAFSGKVEKSGKGIADVKIRVKRDEVSVHVVNSDANGDFKLNLELGFEYVISFKKEGFNDQSMIVNTDVGNIADTSVYTLKNWKVNMSDNMANSLSTDFMSFLLNKPAGKIYFNKKKKEFTSDGVYVNLFKRQIKGISKSTQALLAQAAEDKKQLEIENLKMEAAQKMNEIFLLKQSQDLVEAEIRKKESEILAQRLEKEKSDQALAMADQDKKIKELRYEQQKAELAKKQLEAEKNAKELEHLAILKRMQDYELREKQIKLNETNQSLELSVEENKKRQVELDLAKREKEIQEHELERKMFYVYVLILGLILILFFAFFVYRNLQAKKKANTLLQQQAEEIKLQKNEIEQKSLLLEQKNIETEQSIQYAKRIQHAILPPHSEISKYLKDYFILYKSKDIVSGDFYFFSDKHAKDGIIHIASVDCTGHGVPGAFMSIISINILNNIISDGFVSPEKILHELGRRLVKNLSLNNSSESIKDGLDIALCSFNKKTKTLKFSGAHNSMYLIRNNELTEIHADKIHIGKTDSVEEFKCHQIEIQENDSIYLFTDGFVDQKGGEKNKKFYYPPFRDLLVSIHQNDLEKQSQLLENTIDDWMKNTSQIDDMCVMGIKF